MKITSLHAIKVFLICCLSLAIGQTLTLDQYQDYVLKNHPLFQKEQLTNDIEAFELQNRLGDQDWIISSNAIAARQTSITSSAFTPEKTDVLGFGSSISKSIWNTGGQFSAGWAWDYSKQHGLEPVSIPLSEIDPLLPDIPIDTGPATMYSNQLTLSYTQPLLQNYRGTLDRLSYELAQISVNITELQTRENQEQFLLDMISNYLDWVLLIEQQGIANDRLELAQQQLENTQKKRDANLVDELDVLRSEDAVRLTEQGLVLINSQLSGLKSELSILLKKPDLQNDDPDFSIYERTTLPEQDLAVQRLLSNSRILQQIEYQQQLIERQRSGYADMVKPMLAVNGQLVMKGGGEDGGDSFNLDKSDYSISAGFNVPLGNRSAKSRLDQTDVRLRQLHYLQSELKLSLEGSMRNLVVQIQEFEKVLDLNIRHIDSAREKTINEQERYNQGRGDLTFVIQSQDSEAQARLTYAQNAMTYQSLLLQYRALLDELMPK